VPERTQKTPEGKQKKRSKRLQARQDAGREKEEFEEPQTPQEIIAALKKHRLTLATMLYNLFTERQKHKLGSFQVQAMGTLLSELDLLLNRLEELLPAEKAKSGARP
jgi:hypothetical protein